MTLKGAKQCIEGAKTRILEIVEDLVWLFGKGEGGGVAWHSVYVMQPPIRL